MELDMLVSISYACYSACEGSGVAQLAGNMIYAGVWCRCVWL